MKTRIITACILLPLFFAILFFLPPVFFMVAICLLSVVSVYELLWRSGLVKDKFLIVLSYICAVCIPLCVNCKISNIILFAGVFLFVILMFSTWLIRQKEISIEKISMTFFATLVLPAFYSAILAIYNFDSGKTYVLIPFLAAWVTDTGAYFVGVFFGKHKLAPTVSPKKTVEGSLGGIITCMLGFFIYAIVINVQASLIPGFVASGLVLSVISQIGDLSMSLIKREKGIKDYGVIFPGHGGVLDRFDSVLFTAPATFVLLKLFFV